MLALVLAATVLPVTTPQPQPQPALVQLKTIARLRATPFCSALRSHVAPAIEHIMATDKAIDASPPIFKTMYRDDVVLKSTGRMNLDVQHMESLITPMTSNIEAAEALLRNAPLGEIGRQLQSAIDRQKAALNVVSGFVATYQLGEVQRGGIPDNWRNALSANDSRSNNNASTLRSGNSATSVDGPPPGASILYGAGLTRTPSNPLPPDQQAENVALGFDPYLGFSHSIVQARREGDAAEGAASLAIFAALERCRP
jgi:hypothetical protein